MTAVSLRLTGCIVDLTSSKIKSRATAIARLLEMIQSQNVIDELNDNYDHSPSSVQWNQLFKAVHECLKLETDRVILAAKGGPPKLLPAFKDSCYALTTIVSTATSGKNKLLIKDVISCTLEALESSDLRQLVSESYINVLNSVFSSRSLLNEVSFRQWTELIVACDTLFKESTSDRSQCSIIFLMNLICFYGSRFTGFDIYLKQTLVTATNIFFNSGGKYWEHWSNSITLALTLVTAMKHEFRFMICKFSEDILPHILNRCRMRAGDSYSRNEAVIKLLEETIAVHHPCGVPPKAEGSYAHDWDIWMNHLESLDVYLTSELEKMSKAPYTANSRFIRIVAAVKHAVSKTVFRVQGDSVDEIVHPKRRKVHQGLASITETMSSLKNPAECWPWVLVIEDIIWRYPDMLQVDDFIGILDFLSTRLQNTSDPVLWQILSRCFARLVQSEPLLIIQENCLQERTKPMWDKVWHCTLMKLENSISAAIKKQPSLDPHHLLQSLLLRTVSAQQVNLLLDLYDKRKIPLSMESITTLLTLCRQFVINESRNVRCSLLNWLLAEENIQGAESAQLLSETAFGLILKSKCPYKHSIDGPVWEESEVYLIKSTLDNPPEVSLGTNREPQSSLIQHPDAVEDLFSIVERCSNRVLNEKNPIPASFHGIFIRGLECLTENHKLPISERCTRLLDDFLLTYWSIVDNYFSSGESTGEIDPRTISSIAFFLEFLNKKPSKSLGFMPDKIVEALFSRIRSNCSERMLKNGANEKTDLCSDTAVDCVPSFVYNCLKILISLSQLQYPFASNVDVALIEFSSSRIDLMTNPKIDFNLCSFIAHGLVTRPALPLETLQSLVQLFIILSNKWRKNYENIIRLMNIVKEMLKHVIMVQSSDIRSAICSLISTCHKVITSSKFGNKAVSSFVKILGEIIKIDTNCEWELVLDSISNFTCFHFIAFFRSPFNNVRLLAASYLPVIFNGDYGPSTNEILTKVFDDTISSAKALFSLPLTNDLTTLEIEEESVKRVCCSLHIIITIVITSVRWRRPALYIFVDLIHSKKINPVLVERSLNHIRSQLNITSASAFIEHNLDFVAYNWFQAHKSFDDFPFFVLKCPTKKDFYSNYKAFIIPITLGSRDIDILKEICECIETSDAHILQECFPQLLALILPKLCSDSGESQSEGVAIRLMLQTILGCNVFKSLLSTELDNIITCLYENLLDVTHFSQLCSSPDRIFPLSAKSHINISHIYSTLSYLKEGLKIHHESLFAFLSEKVPVKVHCIIHKLISNLSNEATNDIKALRFHQFATLTHSLALNVPSNEMSGYLIRITLHVCLRLLPTSLGFSSLSFLYKYLKLCLPHSAMYVDSFLGLIVPSMVSLLDKSDGEREIALLVLELLLVEYRQFLASSSNLDPLPELPPLHKIKSLENHNRSLLDEIRHFLEVGDRGFKEMTKFRLEGVRHLLQQLTEKKDELKKLYNEIRKTRGFSKDCFQSPLHRLTFSLVDLATCTHPEVALVASKCLGELGPRDLNTLVLRPESASASLLPKVLLSALISLLVNADPLLVEASAVAIKALLNTKEGFESYESLDSAHKSYVYPFVCDRQTRFPYGIDLEWNKVDDLLHLWAPSTGTTHSTWIINLVIALLNCFKHEKMFRCLIPVIEKSLKLAEDILPYLSHIVLASDEPTRCKIENQINLFFCNHAKQIDRASEELPFGSYRSHQTVYLDRASVNCMLNVVNFYRFHETTSNKLTRLLKLDYLPIARAAQFCKAYFTSVLYAELCIEDIISCSLDAQALKEYCSPLEVLGEISPEKSVALQNLLWEAYCEIGYIDGVYGCGQCHLVSTSARIRYYKQLCDWAAIINECAVDNGGTYDKDLAYALRMSGNCQLAMKTSDLEYECAWRLSNWTLDFPHDGDYSGCLYGALKALHSGDRISSQLFIERARLLVLNSLSNVSQEVAHQINLSLSHLAVIREIELEGVVDDPNRWSDFHGKWTEWEPILSLRSHFNSKHSQYLKFAAAKTARSQNYYIPALKFLNEIDTSLASDEFRQSIRLETAEVIWDSGDSHRAKFLLKILLSEPNLESSILSNSLLTYGKWMATMKSEKPKTIIEKYFKKAAESPHLSPNDLLAASSTLAQFADSEYQRLKKYLKSTEYTTKIETMKENSRKNQEFKTTKTGGRRAEDLSKASRTYEVQEKIDMEEDTALKKEFSEYLTTALEHYLQCLLLGDHESNDLKMYRLVSLWLDHPEDHSVQTILDKCLNRMLSYKFLSVLPQMVVRLSTDGTHFSRLLNSILIRCCKDHPFHSIPAMLALANSYKDEELTEVLRTKKRTKPPRVIAAESIIGKLLADTEVNEITVQISSLCSAYISLANANISRSNPKCNVGLYPIPSSQPLLKLCQSKSIVPCLTAAIPILKCGDYSRVTGIVKFSDTVTLVGGINSPKKIDCVCSDGKIRVQLIKGKDDLRQDAVMQQVFGVINTLLKNDSDTSKRRLMIRTYKVVPTSQRSGIIEWVLDTQPIGAYLAGDRGKPGAHARYRPNDWPPTTCRKKLEDVASKSHSVKFSTYQQICSHFKPVFRHFFTEKYPTAAEWFEKRLAYSKSVATTSMVGYILGIGDRHVLNILIDLVTAEVIHIDFGIAFEQGRILPTPEVVPFRLTRDIVDGMGASGVEGVFRRSSEQTLSALRKNRDPILMTLGVLLYDPLYYWSLTPGEAAKWQQSRSDSWTRNSWRSNEENPTSEINSLAERALERVGSKLEGTEEGGATSSVEGQVNNLIQTAKDPSNLCSLFRGWQAYL